MFNDFFSKQCSTIVDNSSLPTNLTFETENRLSTFDFSTGDIIKIIKVLDPDKVHGHDGKSIRMIKLCAFLSLHILFKNFLENECFPNEWNREKIVPAYKKRYKQLINNYQPVSILPICVKVFEKIIYNSLFEFLGINKLLNNNQSGFPPGDSCMHHFQ